MSEPIAKRKSRTVATKDTYNKLFRFHGFFSNYSEFESGAGNYTVAILEDMQGNITEEIPTFIRFLQSNCEIPDVYIIKRNFDTGQEVKAWRCKNGEPLDDTPIETVTVHKFSHYAYDINDNNKDYFRSDGVEYLYYGPSGPVPAEE